MIKYLKTGAAAFLTAAAMSAPALAADQARNDAEPVRTAAVAPQSVEMVPRTTPGENLQEPEANGWGMLAAGLAVGLLIITRRQRG